MKYSNTLLKWMILGTVAYAVVCMLHWPIGFTMFTQLSNLFVAVTAALQLLSDTGTVAREESGPRSDFEKAVGREKWRPRSDFGKADYRRAGESATSGVQTSSECHFREVLRYVKFAAVVSITVTLLVYAIGIGPFYPGGLLRAYMQDHGASLCMHLLVPLLTLADFYLNDARKRFRWICIPCSLLPPALWMAGIFLLAGRGMRWFGGMAAPYPFLNYLAPAGWFGFAPETAGRATLGIGVFYAILFMMVLFSGIALIHRTLAEKAGGRKG